MKTAQANLLNSFTLIILGIWGYIDVDSPTALIPVFFGVILLLCNSGIKKENKLIAHLAVTFTLIILIALVVTRLEKSIIEGGNGLYRLIGWILTGTIAMITFIRSFIENRKSKQS